MFYLERKRGEKFIRIGSFPQISRARKAMEESTFYSIRYSPASIRAFNKHPTHEKITAAQNSPIGRRTFQKPKKRRAA